MTEIYKTIMSIVTGIVLTFMYFFDGCIFTDTPVKIERYIKKHCNFETSDTCYIDMRKVLKKDYDTMYIIHSTTSLRDARIILGIENYGNHRENDMWIGMNSDSYVTFLIKDNKVVYEDEYKFDRYNTRLHLVSRMCPNHIFIVSKTNITRYKYFEEENFIRSSEIIIDGYLVECAISH